MPDGGNLGPGIGNIRLGGEDRAQIVESMKALTDERVRFDRAPFDHTAICVPVGHVETATGVLVRDETGAAARDRWAFVPAVGRNGHAAPLHMFIELVQGIGRDGSRAHTMHETCAP